MKIQYQKGKTEMKRIITGIIAIMLVAAFAVGASAAVFVQSPDKHKITIISATLDGENVTAKLTVTLYADRNTLPEGDKDQLEAARDQILADDVDAIPANYKVGALFDVTYDGTFSGKTMDVTFGVDFGNATLKVIYKNTETGKWDTAKSSYENGRLTGEFTHFCPVAILVEDSSVIVSDPSEDSPQTGDAPSALMMILGGAVVFGGAVVAVVFRKREDA